MKKAPNEYIRNAREQRGWTQRRLAEELGVAEQTVRTWERGTRSPSLEIRAHLARLFDTSQERLGLQHSQELLLSTRPADMSSSLLVMEPDQADQQSISARLSYLPKDKNRQRMLKRVHSRWITGVLDHSLSRATLITLALQEQPGAVTNPWHFAVQESNLPLRALPVGTLVTNAYDDADGELLILGEPGAGKTTLLLELARDLLKRASIDEAHPIPVVFNLSSWAEERLSLAEWMIKELNTKYQVPQKLGQEWMIDHHILPLLDGLDEVVATHRTACIEAINSYRAEHGFVPMVVCSRSKDYYAQPVRLLLNNAIMLQPLTPQQISDFLSSTGEDLDGLRAALQHDELLQEMASTPLMLSILVQTYQGLSSDTLQPVPSPTMQRQLIFEQYIERVLQRRGPVRRYTPQQTKHWLAWLARQLVQQNQTEFYIERMQPDWLPDKVQHQYRNTIIRLIYGLECLVIGALFAWLRGGRVGNVSGVGAGLMGWLGSGPGNTVLGWMAPGLGGKLEGGGVIGLVFGIVTSLVTILVSTTSHAQPRKVRWSWTHLRQSVTSGLINGLRGGGIVGAFCVLLFGFKGGLSLGLFSGLIIGLQSWLVASMHDEEETRRSKPPGVHQAFSFAVLKSKSIDYFDRLLNGLIIGLCAWLGFGMVDGWLIGLYQAITFGAIVGLLFCAIFGLGNGTSMILGLGTTIQPAETVSWSWKRIRQQRGEYLKQVLFVGPPTALCVTAVIGSTGALFYGTRYGLAYGLVYGLLSGAVVALAGLLTGTLNSGWSSNILEEHQLLRPNEGIHRSARHALIAGCLFGPIGGLASGLISGVAYAIVGRLAGWMILGMGFAIVFGIVFALEFALIRGGIACIEHFVLRWRLWRANCLPWNYVRFLEYATERILLRKIGGGYMFAHRLLLDYFATLDVTNKPPPGDNAPQMHPV